MTAKEYLWQYQDILRDIKNLELEAAQTEALATSAGASVSFVMTEDGEAIMDRVQTSGTSDKIAEVAVAVADLRAEITRKTAWAVAKLKDITKTIDMIQDARLRELLYRRYIAGQKFERIAVEMHYNFRWLMRLNKKALANIQIIIDKTK